MKEVKTRVRSYLLGLLIWVSILRLMRSLWMILTNNQFKFLKNISDHNLEKRTEEGQMGFGTFSGVAQV